MARLTAKARKKLPAAKFGEPAKRAYPMASHGSFGTQSGTVLAGLGDMDWTLFPNVAEIEGDSQYPLQDRWRVWYGPEYQGVPESCVGRLCVVGVLDGPTLLKTLKRGTRKGLWRLESWNAPPREDEKLAWAALVGAIQPR